MFDFAVLFLMLGLAVMALQQVLVTLLGLRGRRLRSALCDLVRGVKFPAGFREDLLIDRVLADKRIDPLSAGGKPSGSVTRVDASLFTTVLKDTLASASPDMLIDGFAKRPDSVRVELRQEIEGLAPRVVEHARKHFDGAMTDSADRYKMSMRMLSIVLGAPVAILGVLSLGSALPLCRDANANLLAFVLLGLGVVLVPLLAAVWYGLLAGVAKLRPARECSAPPARPSSGGRGPAREPRGGKGGPTRSGPADSPRPERPSASGGAATTRRRGRRSTGRRGGRKGGGGSGDSGGGKAGGEASGAPGA